MTAFYYKPTDDVIKLVESVMMRHHEHLEDARIGVLFRDEAPESNGRLTLGMTKKVTDEMRAAGLDYHFIIWFAEDQWKLLTQHQRTALVDHELHHCQLDGVKPKIRPHDFEEFNEIIARYGIWWPESHGTKVAVQAALPLLGRNGVVEAVKGMADVINDSALKGATVTLE